MRSVVGLVERPSGVINFKFLALPDITLNMFPPEINLLSLRPLSLDDRALLWREDRRVCHCT